MPANLLLRERPWCTWHPYASDYTLTGYVAQWGHPIDLHLKALQEVVTPCMWPVLYLSVYSLDMKFRSSCLGYTWYRFAESASGP